MRPLAILKRTVISVTLLIVVIAGLGPWILYWLGLNAIEGRPQPSNSSATQIEKEEIWRKAHGLGTPSITPVTPYGYLNMIVTNQQEPGLLVAWLVAREFNLEHRKYKTMSLWHISGSALTIWLTRNWSSDEILSKAVEIQRMPKG